MFSLKTTHTYRRVALIFKIWTQNEQEIRLWNNLIFGKIDKTAATMLDIKRNGRVHPEDIPEMLRPELKPEVPYETHVSSRASSILSIVTDKQELKELLEVGRGKKQRQTFQMILMVIIPILGLLSITTVTLISTLQTFTKANKAQDQLRAMLQVTYQGNSWEPKEFRDRTQSEENVNVVHSR